MTIIRAKSIYGEVFEISAERLVTAWEKYPKSMLLIKLVEKLVNDGVEADSIISVEIIAE